MARVESLRVEAVLVARPAVAGGGREGYDLDDERPQDLMEKVSCWPRLRLVALLGRVGVGKLPADAAR